MFGKRVILVALALLVGVLGLVAGQQGANAKTAIGPGDARPLPEDWQSYSSGQQVWYAFEYAGDNSPVLIRMSVWPANSLSFSLWTPGDVLTWQQDGTENPVGRGSPSNLYNGDLAWSGDFNRRGTYYVVVEQNGQAPTSTANLTVTGSGVSSWTPPGAVATGAATLAPTGVPVAPPAAALGTGATATEYVFVRVTATPPPPGRGPGDALPVPSGSQSLAPGQRVWYAFDYAGDASQLQVAMNVWPANSASFALWAPGDVRNWTNGGEEKPVGHGTPDKMLNGDLGWVGNFNERGRFYVVVDAGAGGSAVALRVTGTGVSIPVPTSVPTEPVVTPTPLKAAAVEAAPSVAAVAPTAAGAAAAAAAVAESEYNFVRLTATPPPPGRGPGDALALPSGAQTIGAGRRVWYAIHYLGGNEPLLVRMNVWPANSTSFALWAPGDVERWKNGGDESPVGRGTPSNLYNGDLAWSGSFNEVGTFYVVVENTSATDSVVNLSVTGAS